MLIFILTVIVVLTLGWVLVLDCTLISFSILLISSVSLFVACTQSDYFSNKRDEIIERNRIIAERDAVVRLVREMDGCKVYAFKDTGNWHYFTRCPATTTTEATQSYRCGKSNCKRQETMVTNNK